MNKEKLAKLSEQVRIGGKGTQRRKKKVVHRCMTNDDKKLQYGLKKLSLNNIPGIEEVNMFLKSGSVIHFNNPKVQASLASNTFTVTGHSETKPLTEMLPGILNQMGSDSLSNLKRLADALPRQTGACRMTLPRLLIRDVEEVPDLKGDFDEASKSEGESAQQVPTSDSNAAAARM